jgi:hypothetical protein
VGLDVADESEERVIVGLGDRVELVLVAAGAADGQAEKCGGDGADVVVEIVVVGGFFIVGLVVPDAKAIEAGGDEGIVGDIFDFIAGQLLADKLVVGFVLIECAYDVIAIAPGVGFFAVALVAVGLGVADDVEPEAGPALAVARRRGVCRSLFKGDWGMDRRRNDRLQLLQWGGVPRDRNRRGG